MRSSLDVLCNSIVLIMTFNQFYLLI